VGRIVSGVRSYDQGGCVRGVDLCLRRITSSPSQTLRRRLVRTTNDGRRRECSARRGRVAEGGLDVT